MKLFFGVFFFSSECYFCSVVFQCPVTQMSHWTLRYFGFYHHDPIVELDWSFLTRSLLGSGGIAVVTGWTSRFFVQSSGDILFLLVSALLGQLLCLFLFLPPHLFLSRQQIFFFVSALFSLLHCFSISRTAQYEQIAGCERYI